MWGAAIAAIGEAVKSWFEGKTEIKKAKVEREVKALTHESNWDAVQADASKGSWKDEWLTLLVSIPLILAFIPSMSQYVQQGFDVLKEVPEWYMYLVSVVFAASFGIKKITDVIGSRSL